MTEEMKKGYVARVACANRSELVVLIYEMLETCLAEAEAELIKMKSAAGENAGLKSGENEDFRKNMVQFRGFLNELMGSLDYNYAVSGDLMKLYMWIDKQAAGVMYSGELSVIAHIKSLLEKLKKGFEEVAKQDGSPAVMEHTETIYAGLTYGKDSLNETVDIGNEKRGFRV
ncbi:MAG: flagellar protein FliS [Lachnospiraceae bacterium]|nr:flagellar protein FliS [Lachnospiraceae bacterium]